MRKWGRDVQLGHVYLVEWLDAWKGSESWTTAPTPKDLTCFAVGKLVEMTEDKVVLMSRWWADGSGMGGELQIPRATIVNVEEK